MHFQGGNVTSLYIFENSFDNEIRVGVFSQKHAPFRYTILVVHRIYFLKKNPPTKNIYRIHRRTFFGGFQGLK